MDEVGVHVEAVSTYEFEIFEEGKWSYVDIIDLFVLERVKIDE